MSLTFVVTSPLVAGGRQMHLYLRGIRVIFQVIPFEDALDN